MMRCFVSTPKRLTHSLLILPLLLILLSLPMRAQGLSGAFGSTRGIAFEPNLGQVADAEGMQRPDILYTAQSRGLKLLLARNAISYVFQQQQGDWEATRRVDGHITDEFRENFRREYGREFVDPRLAQFRVDREFVGANPNVAVAHEGEQIERGYQNFYLAHCPNGVLGVRSYSQIVYRELYRNIDMVLRSTDSGMKCDFIVRPGGNPADIRMRYVGAERLSLDPEGSITATTPLGYTIEDAPVTYTTDGASGVLQRYDGGVRTSVESRFRMVNGIISFDVGPYDSHRTLVIDPYRLWVTYYGGNGSETVLGGDNTEVDRKGNPYFTGSTSTATGFPVSTGTTQYSGTGSDAVIVKFYGGGARAWAIIYGGGGTGIGELAHGITSDSSGNVYAAGHTSSSGFPVTSGTHQTTYGGGARDAFVLKFDSVGTRLWATLYGGANDDDGYGFGLDSAGNPVLGAASASSGLQSSSMATFSGGTSDALIIKFERNSGLRVWATYFGGGGNDQVYAIGSDINNNVIAVGWTNSDGLATSGVSQTTRGGGYDGFAVKYNSLGTRLWSTYIGGTGTENEAGGTFPGGFGNGYAVVATDFVGNVYVAGQTSSANFPTLRPYQGTFGGSKDAYLVKLDTNGVRLWSTFLGGAGEEGAQGVASNNQGGVLITGYATAVLPGPLLTTNALQGTYGGGARDAFILKLDSSGQTVVYGTMYGGGTSDEGAGISFDPFGSIIVCGETGGGTFATFPNPPAGGLPFQPGFGGPTFGVDAWLALICDIENDLIRHTNGTRVGNTIYLCWNDSTDLYVKDGYRRYQWLTTPDTTARIKNRPSIPGYTVTLTNGAGCIAQSDTVFVSYLPRPNPTFTGPSRICVGDTATVTLNYSTAAGLGTVTYTILDSATRTPQPTLFLTGANGAKTQKFWATGTYFAVIQTSNGCRDTSRMFRIDVIPRPAALSVAPGDTICEGETATLTASRDPITGEIFTWASTTNNNLGRNGRTTQVNTTGLYYLRASNGVCETRSDTVRVLVRKNPVPVINASPGFQFCKGDTITLTAQPGFRRYQWNTGRPGDTTNVIRMWQTATVTLRVTDTNGCQGETSVSVDEVPSPQVFLSAPGLYCEGDTVMLNAGTGFGSNYEWSNGVSGLSELPVTTSGKYKVKVRLTTFPYCEGESNEVTVTFRPRPRVDIAGPLAACVGSLTSYTTLKANGVTYIWTVTGAGGSIVSGQGTDSVAVRWGASAGTGRVKLTIRIDSSYCARDTTLDVAVGSALKPSVVPGNNVTLCPGDSVQFSIGNGYVFQEWTDKTGAVRGSTPDLVVRDSGIYFVKVRDANGCSGESDTIRVKIASPKAPAITASGPTAICPDSAVVLTATPGYRSYRWEPGGQTNGSIPVRDTGSYRVVAVDSNGCTVTSDPIRVTFATPPSPEIVGPGSVCVNSSSSYSVLGGSSGSAYAWTISSGVGTIVAGQGTSTISVNWGATAGAVSLSVIEQDLTTRCSGASDPFFVNVNTSLVPTISSSSGRGVLCDGDSLVLRAQVGYTSYTWRDASGSSTLSSADTLVVKGPGTYTVSVSDGTCSGSADFTVTQKGPIVPGINPNGPLQFCEGDSVELRADPGYARYLWSTGDTTEWIIAKASGTYSVIVTDADGCIGTSGSLSTTMTQQPAAMLTKNDDTLTASPSSSGYTFRWFRDGAVIPGATAPTYVTSLNGRYTVEISTGGLCPDTASLDVGGVALASIGVKEFQAAPGETVTIPVMLWSEQNLDRNGIRTFTMRFRYDRSLLVPLDASWPSAFADTDRVLTLSGTLPTGFSPGGDPLVTLRFVAAIGKKVETPLVVEDVVFGEGTVATTVENGVFRLSDLCTNGGTRLVDASGSPGLKSVRPNPAQGATELEYETVEDGAVRIILVNTLGQTIPVMEATVTRGRYIVPFDARQLPSGIYTVILTTPTQQWRVPMRVQE